MPCREHQLEILRLTSGILDHDAESSDSGTQTYANLANLTGLKELDLRNNVRLRDAGKPPGPSCMSNSISMEK